VELNETFAVGAAGNVILSKERQFENIDE